MAETDVVLKFTPANPGDFLRGVPPRDLTEADMANIEPQDLRDMTVCGPSGTPMYTYADAKLAKAQKPVNPATVGPQEPEPDAETPPASPEAPAARRAGTSEGADAE